MRVYVQGVDPVVSPRTGRTRWNIYLEFSRWSPTSDVAVYTWSDWEASLCEEARKQGLQIALETAETAWGLRIQAVCLVERVLA